MGKKIVFIVVALAFIAIHAEEIFLKYDFNDRVKPADVIYIGGTAGATSGEFATGFSGTGDYALNTSNYPAATANPETAGIKISVSTAGKSYIKLIWHNQHSNTGANRLRLQYTVNGTDWIDFSANETNAKNERASNSTDVGFDNGLYVTNVGAQWFYREADLSYISAVNNNVNFAVRFVTAFQSGGNNYVGSGGNYGPSGTIRYDNVTFIALDSSTPPPPDKVASPVANPIGFTFTEPVSVSLTCSTAGATIYFTTDNSNPSASNGTPYTQPIAINTTTTLKFRAEKAELTPSDIMTESYVEYKPDTGEDFLVFDFNDDTKNPSINLTEGNITFTYEGGAAPNKNQDTGDIIEFAAGVTGNPDRALNTSNYAPEAPNQSAGIQIMASTKGFTNVKISWYNRFSTSPANRLRLQYTVNGTNWLNFDADATKAKNEIESDQTSMGFDNGLYITTSAGASTGGVEKWVYRTADLSGITTVNNNPDFGIRFVAAYPSGASAYAGVSANFAITGTIRFDNVTFKSDDGTPKVPTPYANPRGETGELLFESSISVTLACSVSDAMIYFTTDGSSPTSTHGTLYTTPIEINKTTTLKFRADKEGFSPSVTVTETYKKASSANDVVFLAYDFENNNTNPAQGNGILTLIGDVQNASDDGNYPAGIVPTSTRALNTNSYPTVSPETAGIQIKTSTSEFENIKLKWHNRHSRTAANRLRLQYTINGIDWVNFVASATNASNNKVGANGELLDDAGFDNGLYTATDGNQWWLRAADFSAITGVNNNNNFAVRFVTAYPTGQSVYKPSNPTGQYDPAAGTVRFDNITFTYEKDTSNSDIVVSPSHKLIGNYPNPFNPTTTISFELKSNTHVNITIFNIKGQKIRTLVNELKTIGSHNVLWNGMDDNNSEVASGIYLYQMVTKDDVQTRKAIMVK